MNIFSIFIYYHCLNECYSAFLYQVTVAWNYIKNVINTEPCGIKSILMLCVISYISFSMYTRNGDWFEITIWKFQIGKFICLLSKILHIIIYLFINSEWTRTLLYETFLETISFLRNPSSDPGMLHLWMSWRIGWDSKIHLTCS